MEDEIKLVDKPSNLSRLRYGRDRILEIKERSAALSVELYEGLVDASALSQINERSKPKLQVPKGSSERERQQKTIVLGPQKRTWNTGCHVSYNGCKESGDGYTRSGKSNSETRLLDKQYIRHPSEYRRGGGRERGNGKRVDGSTSNRFYRDERYREHRRSSVCEEEPEWFSEGPTTVNDTIELGRILDDPDEDHADKKDHHIVSPTKCNTDYISRDSQLIAPAKCSPTHDAIIPDSSGSANTETQGSRFKHFFSSTENDQLKTKKINDQLMRLLKGSTNTDVSSFDKNNIENKLRSILLGNGSENDEKRKSNTSNAKSRILTVEEIESQLNSSCSSTSTNADRSTTVAESQRLAGNSRSNADTSSTSHLTHGSNLALMIQSLASRQQSSTAKPPQQLNNLTNMAGFHNTTITPPSTSTRINQLQQFDLCASPGTPGSQQGVLRQLWDPNSIDQCVSAAPSSQQLNMMVSQRLAGVPPGLYSDIGHKLVSGSSPNMPNQHSLMPPRRPIVKVQQNVATSPGTQGVSFPNIPNSTISQRFGLNFQDAGHSLMNSSLGAQVQPRATLHGVPFPTASNENRFGGVESQSFFDSFVSVPNNNNSNVNNPFYSQKVVNSAPKSDNTLAFLSRLVDMDRSGVTLNHLKAHSSTYTSTDVKAKTLEEIEHQEISSSGLFY